LVEKDRKYNCSVPVGTRIKYCRSYPENFLGCEAAVLEAEKRFCPALKPALKEKRND
jgi:hypothetical protein